MPRYSEALINDICAANDIVDYVSKYVQLKKSGRDYSGLCPFHNEKTPSFHVSADKQLFHCFGCGASGNLVQFVMRAENLDFVDALKLMADNAGISLPEEDYDFNNEQHKIRKQIFEMNKTAARFFYQQLTKTNDGKQALQYLYNRHIAPRTVNIYGLGYAPPSYDALLNHLRDAGYSDDLIVSGSLAVRRDGKIYDKFRDRVMFPIIDTRGNIIGFGGRIMKEIIKDGYKSPKYLNSSETPVFDKGSNLFSLNLAKNSDLKKIILVEGYMDVITVYQAGITNIVATLGTAITDKQAKLLSRYANEILICYDSDEAGQKATSRAIEVLSGANVRGRVIRLKGAKDPDEYIKTHGLEAFRTAIKKAVPFTEYKISLLKTEYDLSETDGKIGFVNEAAEILSGVSDAIEVDAYIKKISEETDISRDAIYAEYGKKVKKAGFHKKLEEERKEIVRTSVVVSQDGTPIRKDNVRLQAEKRLLALLLQEKKIFSHIKELISPYEYSTEVYKKLAGMIYEKREHNEEVEAATLLNEFNKSPELQNEAASVFYNMEIYGDKEQTAMDLTKTILISKLEQEIKECKDNIKMMELIKQRAELSKSNALWS